MKGAYLIAALTVFGAIWALNLSVQPDGHMGRYVPIQREVVVQGDSGVWEGNAGGGVTGPSTRAEMAYWNSVSGTVTAGNCVSWTAGIPTTIIDSGASCSVIAGDPK